MMFCRMMVVALLMIPAGHKTAWAEADKLATCEVPERISYPYRTYWWGEIKNGLVGDIYDLRRAESVLSSGVCSCGNMFPAWDEAVAEAEERFKDAPEKGPTPDWVKALTQEAADKKLEAVRFCKSEGAY